MVLGLDVRIADYYRDSGLPLSGSIMRGKKISEQTFNYLITPVDGTKLIGEYWIGSKCKALSEVPETHEEELSADGLEKLVKWIKDKEAATRVE